MLRPHLSVFLFALLPLGAACVTSASDSADDPPPSFDGCVGATNALYRKSLERSWRAPPRSGLANPLLRPKDEQGRILVVTLNNDPRVDDKVGQEVALTKELWVTLAPDLQVACARSRIEGISDKERLHQLVGVPTEKNYDRVTAYWVAPSGLFRPCEDREVDDTECNAPSDEWLRDASGTPRCYPFTGVGYTWDWLADAPGLSEFQFHTSERRKERGDVDTKAEVHCVYKDLSSFCDDTRPPSECPTAP